MAHRDAVQIDLLGERGHLVSEELAVLLPENGLAHQVAVLGLADLGLVEELAVTLAVLALDLRVRLAEGLVRGRGDSGADGVVYLVAGDRYAVGGRGLRDHLVLDD